MQRSEQKRATQTNPFPHVTINVNSPNNCIVSGDRIEISIHMNEQGKPQVQALTIVDDASVADGK